MLWQRHIFPLAIAATCLAVVALPACSGPAPKPMAFQPAAASPAVTHPAVAVAERLIGTPIALAAPHRNAVLIAAAWFTTHSGKPE